MDHFITYDFDISKIVLSTCVRIGQGDRFHRNRPSHGLVYMIDGVSNYLFDSGQTETVCKNQLFYLPKFSSYERLQPLQGACFAINFLLVDEHVTFPFFQLPTGVSKQFEKYFVAIEQFWKGKPIGYQLKCKSLLYDLLYSLQKSCENAYLPAAQRNRLNIATEYIWKHFLTEKIKVSVLAEISGITPEYLRILFQKAYGVSPHKYISNIKTARAQELLSSGEFSVNDVAELCGYSSVGYFCRDFKKQTFLTPAKYKKGQHSRESK